jgi:hypothetical protein
LDAFSYFLQSDTSVGSSHRLYPILLGNHGTKRHKVEYVVINNQQLTIVAVYLGVVKAVRVWTQIDLHLVILCHNLISLNFLPSKYL